MPRPIYADFNATTPLGEAAIRSMTRAFEIWGNPSSAHKTGRQARELLEEARGLVATAAGAEPKEIVFTSGGSEANTLALLGSRFLVDGEFRVLTSKVEHSSVGDTFKFLKDRGTRIEAARLLPTGELDLEDFEKRLREFKPHLVSLMVANNETGVLFPIPQIAKLCAQAGTPLHSDAVQAFGKIPNAFWEAADLVSVSAHKIYGPKGVGALIVRDGRKLVPTHYGGSQEIKRRGGTENMIGIAGFGGAASEIASPSELAMTENSVASMNRLRDFFERLLLEALPDITINCKAAPRLPNTSNIRFHGIASEVLLGALDLDGVAVSAGSACSSGSITPSHVLTELGLSADEARECLRISWGRPTTEADIAEVASLIVGHVKRIRARRAGA